MGNSETSASSQIGPRSSQQQYLYKLGNMHRPDDNLLLKLSERIGDWWKLAKYLGLTDAEIEIIETKYSNIDRRCYNILKKWNVKNYFNENGTVEYLKKMCQEACVDPDVIEELFGDSSTVRDIHDLEVENEYLRKTLADLHQNIIAGDEELLKKLESPKSMKDYKSILDVEANVKEITQTFHQMRTDVHDLEVENEYLRKTLAGLHQNIIAGDEELLKKLESPKSMKDYKSILDVEANVKEITQTFHQMRTDVHDLEVENEYLRKTLAGLHQNIIAGDEELLKKLESPKSMKDYKSILDVEANVKEITQTFHQMRTEVEYVECLLEELAQFSQSTNNGDNGIILSHPQHFETSLNYKTKDARNTETSESNPTQSVHNQKMMEHYGNASHVLKLMKENKRLSEHAGALLTYKNPCIAALSDPNRPTKVAEKYSELYDKQWNDAFENFSKRAPSISDDKIIGYLYEMLVDGYRFCEDVRQTQKLGLEDILFYPAGGIKSSQRKHKEEISKQIAKILNDVAKLSSNVTGANMAKAFVMDEKTKGKYREIIQLCETYIQECLQLCWLMQVQTPPLYLDLKTVKGQEFDTNYYKEYTQNGKTISVVLWPALFLHENGSLLYKGVAKCQ